MDRRCRTPGGRLIGADQAHRRRHTNANGLVVELYAHAFSAGAWGESSASAGEVDGVEVTDLPGGIVVGDSRTLISSVRDKGPARYWAVDAGDRAGDCARRRWPCLLAMITRLRDFVAEKLFRGQVTGTGRWPSGQGSRHLVGMWVSHATIYKSLFIQDAGCWRGAPEAPEVRSADTLQRSQTVYGAVAFADQGSGLDQ
ncbi:hypothetical protein ACIHFE_33830 [Streptomyces sp. NPDC052396]|uniref:hypothetical protein n=1 Tax=Streptomyces sp. NPDC052396 TaxID=3365689 RepID=UPI0037D882ED